MAELVIAPRSRQGMGKYRRFCRWSHVADALPARPVRGADVCAGPLTATAAVLTLYSMLVYLKAAWPYLTGRA
jgi:hypothetical protein